MTTKTLYIADDGEEFETEKECYEYEHRFDKIKQSNILFFNNDKKLLNKEDIENCITSCFGLYVSTEEEAKLLYDAFEYYGIENPWSRYDETFTTGYFIYTSYWQNVENELNYWNNIKNTFIKNAI